MKEITALQLAEWRENNVPHQLVDVREEHEVANGTIGGQHIPMDEVIANVSLLSREVPVVIHCNSGKRSAAVVHALEQKFALENLYSLEGGIMAWIEQVDSSVMKS